MICFVAPRLVIAVARAPAAGRPAGSLTFGGLLELAMIIKPTGS